MSKLRHRLIGMIAVLALFLSIAGSVSSPAMVDATSVSGPVQFLEIYFMSGKDLERRAPNAGEEFRVGARIRNTGSVAFYYLPTLCDSSLSGAFDPLFVKVETGRPRCLALSMPAPLNPGDTVTVTGPESGTAYVAIRPGSTDATVAFRYRMDPNSEEQEARSKVTLMIKDGFFGLEIPGFSAESVLVGLAVAFAFLVYRRKPVVKARVLAHLIYAQLVHIMGVGCTHE